MFEPLRELLPEDPQALLDDPRVLGEKAGRLYGSRSAAAYAALGGATYRPLRCVNEGVVGWSSLTDPTSSGLDSGSSNGNGNGTSSSLSLSKSASTSWLSTALAWCGAVQGPPSRHRRPHRRRGPVSGLYALRALLAAAPHVLPHLLHSSVTLAARVFPSVRTMFPTALPDARYLLERRQSCAGGPERVTALSFHPLYLWLAVAVDEGAVDGSSRVVIYDVAEEKIACVLSHAFQQEVGWLAWKPFAADVLVVGCRGGVLVWSVSVAAAAGVNSGDDARGPAPLRSARSTTTTAAAPLSMTAHALFYRICHGFTISSAAFSNCDGSMLACASAHDTRLHLLNLRQPPFSPLACAAVVVPSVDGGVGDVLFADDDGYLICAVCEHPSLALIRCAAAASASSESPAVVLPQTTVVPVPAPVHCIAPASGLGASFFFLATSRLEGVVLARIRPFLGVEVMATISTGLYRGVGGCVTRFTCSRRRLWMLTETNHLVVCRYGQREGEVSVLPVGVAAMEAVALVNYDGCTTGSLVAVLERDGTVTMLPSYHS